jgi:Mg2+/Co2+ transporter CorB
MVTIVFVINLSAYFTSASETGEYQISQNRMFVRSKPNVAERPEALVAVEPAEWARSGRW